MTIDIECRLENLELPVGEVPSGYQRDGGYFIVSDTTASI
jgi:hypothetical protein